ncbi:MAG: class B sortase [Oscillospiraceae bacterium]|nr:class B sortase [Oscillospiraceae bacterium]
MKKLYQIAETANHVLLFLLMAVALLIFLYSAYVLYDIYYINQNAFVSRDLLQYRPVPAETEEQPLNGFSELLRMNPDTVGWLSIDGTNINYPVVQGENDLEYASKDIYGNSSLTGSIYLASENDRRFHDWYHLLYGHHMDNGAMFGDIDKYQDADFFYSHQKGLLQTPQGDYTLSIFACVLTDSYQEIIYHVASKDISVYPELTAYIQEHSVNYDNRYSGTAEQANLLAMSTCTDASTNGRIVLFAEIVPEKNPVVPEIPESTEKTFLKAEGHPAEETHWAFLNLLCLFLVFLILFPFPHSRIKYHQISDSRSKEKMMKEILQNQDKKILYTQEEQHQLSDVQKAMKRFRYCMSLGSIMEGFLFLLSVILFLLTESMWKPVIIADRFTGWMLLLCALALSADILCFRYRGTSPETIPEERNGTDAS